MPSVFIGFSRPIKNTAFAKIIQLVESRPYDHVYIRVQEPVNGTWMVFQASGLKVNLLSANCFFKINTPIKEYEIKCTDSKFSILWNFIDDNLGLPYSLIEDFGILLMKIFKLKNQPFNKNMSAWFCSKLGAMVCQILDIVIPENISNVDPTMLDSILSKLNVPINNSPSSKY